MAGGLDSCRIANETQGLPVREPFFYAIRIS